MLDWSSWNAFLESARLLIAEHWTKLAAWLIALIVPALWAGYLARRKWKSRYDYDVIHISQNTLQKRKTGPNGEEQTWLVLDVHVEDPLEKMITHPVPRKLIRKAAKRTTVDQPFLRLDPSDRWYVLNIVRLAIAEPFKHGTVAKLSPQARVETVDCVFALTYERYAEMRQGKIRVMLIGKAILDDPDSLSGNFSYEATSHKDRLTTLRMMQQDYLKGNQSEFCMTVRINVPL